MKRTFIKKGILACIATILTVASSFAQTITTGAVSPAAVCSGSKISAAFTKTGTFPTGTEFTLQLSDAAGAFTSPVEIGTGTTSPIEGTVTAAAGTGYKVRVISVTPAVTGAASAAFTVNAIPAAPTVSNVNYKVGDDDAEPLEAGGTGLLWYTAATGGSGKATAPTPSTTTAGTTSYYVSQTIIDCESPRAKIDVIVAACTPPAAPTVTPTVSYTINTIATQLEATGVKNAVFKWYSSASSTIPLAGAPTPPTITAVTLSYFVTQTVGGCESAKSEIVVTINACTPPPAPVVTNKSYTIGDTAPALTGTGTALKWYPASGGSGSATAPVPSTTTAGTTSYFVTQTVGGCESAKAEIVVTISACTPPPAPVVTNKSYTIGDATSALTATGTALKWYSASGGSGSATAPVPSTTTAGTTSYFVTQTVGGCESAKAEIKVTVSACILSAAPTVTSPINYCASKTAIPALVAEGTAIQWYNASQAKIPAPVPNVNVNSKTVYTYFVTQKESGKCESEKKEVTITVNVTPGAPTIAQPLVEYCQNSTAAALTTSGGLNWYTTQTGGQPLASPYVPSTASVGLTIFYASQTIAGCEGSARSSFAVNVKAGSALPTVTSPTVYCATKTAIPALVAKGTAVQWYNAAKTKIAAPSPDANVSVKTIYTYFVTQTETSKCESDLKEVTVTINPLPAALTSVDEAKCQELTNNTYSFPTKPANGNSINWYTTSTGGSSIAAPVIPLNTPVEKTYYVTQTANSCESASPRSVQKIKIKPLPGLPGIDKPLIEYCQFVQAEPLTANKIPANTTLNWYGTDPSGTPSSTAPVPSTAEGTTTSFYVGQTLEGCVGAPAKIDVKINTTPVPQTTTYLAYCQGVTAPRLEATGSVLKWYRASTDTEFQGFPYTPFTEKVEDYSFYVTQTGNNGCESPKEEIKIHIKALPSATISGNTTIALGETANITLKFTSDGPWKYVLSNGVTDSTSEATKAVSVTPKTTTTYLVTGVSNACGKGTPIGSALITVKIPTINSGNPSVSEACAGKTFGVPFQQSGDFPDGNKFNVQISLVNEDSKFYTIPSVASSNLVTATFPDTTRSGNYFVRVISSGTNPDLLVRGSVSAVGISANPLPLATISGTQTILIGDSGDLKVEFTGKGPWSFGLYNGVRDSTITANSTPYSFKISPRVTATYTISSVTNGCGKGRSSGSARVQVDPILGVEPPVTDWVKVYPTIIAEQCKVEVDGTISPKEASVQIIDMNGRSLSEKVIRQKITEVDFSRYPSGLYLLRIQNGNLNSVHRVMKP